MTISDLNYLEVVKKSEKVEGGIGNFLSIQQNYTIISQNAEALAGVGLGNLDLLNLLNLAAAANVAAPVQVNA
jgi:hypothetical protein